MKVLLDECLPRKLGRALTGHEASTVPEMGWASIANGRLLALAQEQFDVLLTNDGELEHQQNLSRFNIAIVVLRLRSNKLRDILPFVPTILAALTAAKRGHVTYVDP
ncbi:MAG TPA: DUF5615 family PIN-like protein [Verrucomicrobiae bacterium]|nr:DUF5615 family PIN-like protein [Verrucomicrobiae bacterium]